MNILAYYMSTRGGVIAIVQEDNGFNARWTGSDFKSWLQVGAGSALNNSRETTEAYARSWDPGMTPLSDLGLYPLYSGNHPGQASVHTDYHEGWGFTQPVEARSVPVGATLTDLAAQFFTFWLGEGAAVRDEGAWYFTLRLQPPQ
jgi:hypothetical protein